MADKQETLDKIRAEMERRHEEKKKEKEALYYFTAAYIDKVKAQEEAELEKKHGVLPFFETLAKDIRKAIVPLQHTSEKLIASADRTEERKLQFFDFDENAPENQELAEVMKELNLEKKHVAAVALCAAEDKMPTVMDYVSGRMPQKDAETKQKEMEQIKSSSFVVARDAIVRYHKGDRAELGKRLCLGLKNACRRFSDRKTGPEEAMEWSMNVEEMLYIAKKDNRLLADSGLTEEQILSAEKIGAAHRSIRTAYEKTRALVQMREMGITLSPEQEEAFKLQIDESLQEMNEFMNKRSEYADCWKEAAPEIEEQKKPEVPQMRR